MVGAAARCCQSRSRMPPLTRPLPNQPSPLSAGPRWQVEQVRRQARLGRQRHHLQQPRLGRKGQPQAGRGVRCGAKHRPLAGVQSGEGLSGQGAGLGGEKSTTLPRIPRPSLRSASARTTLLGSSGCATASALTAGGSTSFAASRAARSSRTSTRRCPRWHSGSSGTRATTPTVRTRGDERKEARQLRRGLAFCRVSSRLSLLPPPFLISPSPFRLPTLCSQECSTTTRTLTGSASSTGATPLEAPQEPSTSPQR